MDLIDKHPGWSMLGAGALGGIGGYMLSSGGNDDQNNNQNDNQQQEYTWPEMGPNYQPTINIPRDTVKYYYANGGITGIGQPDLTAQPPETPEAPPVNKFYADALAQAQQAVAQQAPEEAPVEDYHAQDVSNMYGGSHGYASPPPMRRSLMTPPPPSSARMQAPGAAEGDSYDSDDDFQDARGGGAGTFYGRR